RADPRTNRRAARRGADRVNLIICRAMTRRALMFAAVLCVLVAAAAGAPRAQPPPPPPQPQPTFRTEANYVRVDVFPTLDGAPVVDLTRDDFEIFENGAPQKLEQ